MRKKAHDGVFYGKFDLDSNNSRCPFLDTDGLAPIRALCVDILQNRAVSLSQRMLCLGMVIQRLQKEDWTAFDPDTWVEQMSALTSAEEIVKITADIPGNRDMYLLQNLKVLGAISAAEKAWTAELYESLDAKHQVTLTVQEDGGFQKDAQFKMNCSREAYEDALAQFQAVFPDREYFFENLMVAVVLLQDFPALTSKEELWKSYVSLCNLYSFFRFVSVVGCKGNATKERLFHMIVMASRATLHSRERLNGFQKELFQNDSSTLAHRRSCWADRGRQQRWITHFLIYVSCIGLPAVPAG